MTGPAMVKILAPSPKTNPSDLNSMAGDATALANPVMGTNVPAPACFAKLSYTSNAVSSTLAAMSTTQHNMRASLVVIPSLVARLITTCPTAQIVPPIKKALMQFFTIGDGGDAFLLIA